MSKFRRKLKRASKLVNQDKPEEALEIVRPILEQEPDNALAWWVVAYAVDDPQEAHSALTKVLELDPDFEHADKARDMLDTLNAQYPTLAHGDESFFPDAFSEDLFESGTDTEPVQPTAAATPADEFFEDGDDFPDFFATETESEPDSDMMFDDEVPFMLEDAEEEQEATEFDEPEPEEQQVISFIPSEDMTDDELAALEEEAARKRRRGSGRRRLALTGLALLVLVVLAVALVLGLSGGDSTGSDPGSLQVVESGADQVAAVNDTVQNANLGQDRQAVLAQSTLGTTLFIQICDEAGPGLQQTIIRGMELAADQAPMLTGDVEAAGVSVDLCNGDTRDSLYRAFASLDDIQRYLDGDFGTGREALARFQAVWQTP